MVIVVKAIARRESCFSKAVELNFSLTIESFPELSLLHRDS
jgi:hypothetical protein